MIRVLMLTAYPAIGGPLPKLAPLMADGLRGSDCEVETMGWSAHRAGHESLVAKVTGRALDLLRVLRRVRAWQPHAIYVATSHNWPALLRDVPLLLALPRARARVVLHLHGSESFRLAGPGRAVFRALSRIAVRRAAAVLLLSCEELAEWQRFCPDVRFEVVVNPFVARTQTNAGLQADAGDDLPAPSDTVAPVPTLLFVARLIAQKGVFDLLDATSQVCHHRPCRLLIAGTGPERTEIERRITQLRLDGEVTVLGYVEGDDLDRAYRAADVFVLPSYFAEGFPLAVMEAMGYGLPIVTTPIRGCADHLVAGRHAVFVPPRRPAVLAAALESLLDDPELRERMAQANLLKVAEFAPDVVLPRYAQIMHEVAAEAYGAR